MQSFNFIITGLELEEFLLIFCFSVGCSLNEPGEISIPLIGAEETPGTVISAPKHFPTGIAHCFGQVGRSSLV